MPESGPGVLLCLPDLLVRTGLRSAVEATGDLAVLAEAPDLDGLFAALAALPALRPVDVVLLGLALAPRQDLLEQVLDRCGTGRLLVLAEELDHEALLLAVDAGAAGFLSTRSSLQSLVEALRAVSRGQSVVPPEMLGGLLTELVDRSRRSTSADRLYGGLSRREKEVLGLLAEGCDAALVADRLVISPQTARSHIAKVLRKLDVHSQAEATAFALRLGLGATTGSRSA